MDVLINIFMWCGIVSLAIVGGYAFLCWLGNKITKDFSKEDDL